MAERIIVIMLWYSYKMKYKLLIVDEGIEIFEALRCAWSEKVWKKRFIVILDILLI